MPENRKKAAGLAPWRRIGRFWGCCIKKSAERVSGRRRFVLLTDSIPLVLQMMCGSPSLCLKSEVARLGQTADQLNAINGIIQIAP